MHVLLTPGGKLPIFQHIEVLYLFFWEQAVYQLTAGILGFFGIFGKVVNVIIITFVL